MTSVSSAWSGLVGDPGTGDTAQALSLLSGPPDLILDTAA